MHFTEIFTNTLHQGYSTRAASLTSGRWLDHKKTSQLEFYVTWAVADCTHIEIGISEREEINVEYLCSTLNTQFVKYFPTRNFLSFKECSSL